MIPVVDNWQQEVYQFHSVWATKEHVVIPDQIETQCVSFHGKDRFYVFKGIKQILVYYIHFELTDIGI